MTSPLSVLLFVISIAVSGAFHTKIYRAHHIDGIYSSKTNVLTSDVFSLESVRSTLIRQEETIIFALIERAQYRRNRVIYHTVGDNKLMNAYGTPISFLEWMFIETEKLHSKVRRYTSPEEHPFFPAFLPVPILPPLDFPDILAAGPSKNTVNVNSEVMRWYIDIIIQQLCVDGDDEQHGSSVLCDISAMQALSRYVQLNYSIV